MEPCQIKKSHTWKRWSTTQNFFLASIDELEKQLFIKKTVKWANKKHKNFNIYNNVFFAKIKKNTWKNTKRISLFYNLRTTLMLWSTVPEIWSVTNWNWQFWFSFPALPPKNIWCMLLDIWSATKIFVILGLFWPVREMNA